jgi:hypothetical protein
MLPFLLTTSIDALRRICYACSVGHPKQPDNIARIAMKEEHGTIVIFASYGMTTVANGYIIVQIVASVGEVKVWEKILCIARWVTALSQGDCVGIS